MKQVTLWSWLVKSETREEFRCPPGLQVTNEDLATELTKQLQANNLPAQAELCEVIWDDTDTKQKRVIVSYRGHDTQTDIVRTLVGVDQMGNFSYIERKVHLKNPVLPNEPRQLKPEDKGCGIVLLLLIGAITAIVGIVRFGEAILDFDHFLVFIGLLLLIIGTLFILVAWRAYRIYVIEQAEVKDWNELAKKEQAAWDETLPRWRKEVLLAAYLAKTDDVLGRFTSAVSTTIDDAVKTLFIDRDAELRSKTEHEQTQEAVEQELEKRRAEAFK